MDGREMFIFYIIQTHPVFYCMAVWEENIKDVTHDSLDFKQPKKFLGILKFTKKEYKN